MVPCRYQGTRDHDNHVTLHAHADFKRGFFADAIEIVDWKRCSRPRESTTMVSTKLGSGLSCWW